VNDYTALGLPLDWVDEEGVTISPISAIVIAKGMDSEGNETYSVMNSKGLSNIEALGFLAFAELFVQDEVRATLYETYRNNDQNGTSA
jgi:hypothetical protein